MTWVAMTSGDRLSVWSSLKCQRVPEIPRGAGRLVLKVEETRNPLGKGQAGTQGTWGDGE